MPVKHIELHLTPEEFPSVLQALEFMHSNNLLEDVAVGHITEVLRKMEEIKKRLDFSR